MKVTSCACLDGSGLELIFHWKAHFFILSKSSQSCIIYKCKQKSVVRKKVLSLIEDFLSDRLYRLEKTDLRNCGTCGTAALIKPRDEHWPISKIRCFLLSRKLINNCNKVPQIPLRRNL